MKVVFLEDVEGTARVGEVKSVADGFARNYLLPRNIAAPATEHYINIGKAKAEKESRRQAKLDEEVRSKVLPKIEGKAIAIEARVGEQGKLFGSVTARDIVDELQRLTGVEIEHRQVELREAIRDLGAHKVGIRLTRGIRTEITVNVNPLGGQAAAEEAPAPTDGEALEETAGTES